MDRRDLKRSSIVELRQNSRQSFCQHRFARPRHTFE
jgi:hypothetical protein